jgi:beta-lactamase regulating signal transducer with metallopeptidase domain/thiol-disulfide isomerase/thioredoxin/uncharacterized GH25 family protein
MSVFLLLVARITLLLGLAWLLHAALALANPRWRVLTWRTVAAGVVLLPALSAAPPLVSWAVLPPRSSDVAARPDILEDRGAEAASGPTQDRGGQPDTASEDGLRSTTEQSVPQTPDSDRSVATEPARADSPFAAFDDSPAPRFAVLSAAALLRWALSVWALGALLQAGRMALGCWQVERIRRRAIDAPEWVIAESLKAARRLGCKRPFAVLQTRDVLTPCLTGIRRPAILLPMQQCGEDQRGDVPAILAHEIAHLQTMDLDWNLLLQGLSALLWCHPLMWRVRTAHADACDAVSDAEAAAYVGDTAGYGRTLARLAVQMTAPIPPAGLAMARTSRVRARIAALGRRPAGRLARTRVMGLIATGLSIVALLGGVTVTQLPAKLPVSSKPISDLLDESTATSVAENGQPRGRKIEIRAVTAAGTPIEQVVIHFGGRLNNQSFDRVLHTNAGGLATLQWDDNPATQDVRMTVSKAGYVSQHYTWRNDRRTIELPAAFLLRLAPAASIGGIVQDESGLPIAGAGVELMMPISGPAPANYVFTAASLKTDEQGRWEWRAAPADAASVSIWVRHAAYLSASAGASKSMDNLIVLKRGVSVSGRVLDAQGRPISGATARVGVDYFNTNEPQAPTDEAGRFTLDNCRPGKSLVTIQAEGYEPQLREMVVGPAGEPLEFRLETGRRLSLSVADINGRPIAGATVVADTWRGHRTLTFRRETDEQGTIEWRSAPRDAILCDVVKEGYIAVRGKPLQASPDAQVVTLHPQVVISGRVTDAVTGQPVPEFYLRSGQLPSDGEKLSWSGGEGVRYSNGRYSFKIAEPAEGYALRLVAAGYMPIDSRVFRQTDGEQTFDFRLLPGDGLAGTVVLPNGMPAIGADVGLATQERKASLHMGRFNRSQNRAEIVKTNEQGRFAFAPQGDEPFALIVLHEEGFGLVTDEKLTESNRIALTPWGRLSGQVLEGDKPDAKRNVAFLPQPPPERGGSYIVAYGYMTTTDDQGRFELDRVVPGPGTATRIVITQFLRSWLQSYGWQAPVEIAPGTTTEVTVGGSGRPVIGQVRLDREPDVAVDWTTNLPLSIQRWDPEKGQRTAEFFRCLASVDRSGGFRVPDVPAGTYQLSLPVTNPPVPNVCGVGTEIGKVTVELTIPEMPTGRSDEPLDLGTITATLFDTLDAGELAPDFVADPLDGSPLRLSDFSGKLLVVDFWASWCAPCLAEIPALQELHRQFGGDQRFALLSLACDQNAEPARRYVQGNGLDWLHAHVGASSSGVAAKYTVRTLPATFLIGPDGRVLAKNVRGEDLKRAVAAALADIP